MASFEGYDLPGDLYYHPRDHLWARLEPGGVRVGLDMLGQKSAGAVQHLRLRPVGSQIAKGRAFGTIEAGKYVGALRAPVAGSLAEVNDRVMRQPSLVNSDPYGDGWFVVIAPANLEEDLKELVHGEEAVQAWLEAEVKDYRARGLLKD